MNLFCNHDWYPRTGMDSGSFCLKCGKISEKEIDLSKSSGLNLGTLQQDKQKLPSPYFTN